MSTHDKIDLSRGEKLLVMENSEERWRQLCAQAAVEPDSEKLMELVRQISRLLEEKHTRNRIDTTHPCPNEGEPSAGA
jgi:hypothetical protein